MVQSSTASSVGISKVTIMEEPESLNIALWNDGGTHWKQPKIKKAISNRESVYLYYGKWDTYCKNNPRD